MSGLGPPPGRGGPQIIPRPAVAVRGQPAPWAELAPHERVITATAVRRALSGRRPGVGITGAPGASGRDAAVLAPLYEGDDGELRVILTRRSPLLRSHTHQVSFPGGVQDPGETLLDTALREANEEVGLAPGLVDIVGQLDHLRTFTSGSAIVPFVGVLTQRPQLAANPAEVEAIIDVAVSELTADGVHREERWDLPLELRGSATSHDLRPIQFFELVGDTVWGATARLLHQLISLSLGLDDGDDRR